MTLVSDICHVANTYEFDLVSSIDSDLLGDSRWESADVDGVVGFGEPFSTASLEDHLHLVDPPSLECVSRWA